MDGPVRFVTAISDRLSEMRGIRAKIENRMPLDEFMAELRRRRRTARQSPMLRLIAAENVCASIVAGLRRCLADVDVVRVQAVGLRTAAAETTSAWAAAEGRVLLTRDARTIPDLAHARVRRGETTTGAIVVTVGRLLDRILDDPDVIATCSADDEW